jgi:hypothetical protein
MKTLDERRAVLERAIRRKWPGTKAVFDDDGEHVYIGPIDGTVQRHRLGAQAQQFLHGEFDKPPAGGLEVWLHPPRAGRD